MSEEIYQRTELILGKDGVQRLKTAKVALFGVGGVGGFAAEALARAGVGEIHLFDRDVVSESNINRQIVALRSTVGRYKTEVMAERIGDINPNIKVVCHNVFYLPENAEEYPLEGYDYVLDAVDTVSAKLEIVVRCKRVGVPVISAMGAGNKADPCAFMVGDIYSTEMCPLARVMRRELKARGVKSLKVVFSKEKPVSPKFREGEERVPASLSFVPSVAGLIMAGEVIKDIAGYHS